MRVGGAGSGKKKSPNEILVGRERHTFIPDSNGDASTRQ